MLTQSDQIDQLAAALADVQALIDVVLKESPNAVYGSRYAELSKVWQAFQRVGPDHGLSVVQLPGPFDPDQRTMSMSVRLMHSSGQWIGGEMSMPLSRADAHAYGSACTYARRYSLAALVGICPHDDDGNAASSVDMSTTGSTPSTLCRSKTTSHVHGLRHVSQAYARHIHMAASAPNSVDAPSDNPAAQKASQAPAQVPFEEAGLLPQDPQQLQELEALIVAAGVEAQALCRHYRVTELSDLSPRDAARARRALTKKIDEKQAAKEVEEAC